MTGEVICTFFCRPRTWAMYCIILGVVYKLWLNAFHVNMVMYFYKFVYEREKERERKGI